MRRREFVAAAGAAAAAGTIASPAVAQAAPEVRWRCASSFPKSLDVLFGAADVFAKAVAEMTDNRFQIQTHAAGEIVPGVAAADAVTNGVVEMCHTASYYYIGKDPSFAFATCLPFGCNARQQNAWLLQGGGLDLVNDFMRSYNTRVLVGGNTGVQMGGWFRKEVKTVADLSGLKMRIGGVAGRILQKLGVVPQQLASGDLHAALDKGTLDAAEWVGPYDDEKLGLNKVAPYYYYPGWWEGGAALQFFINDKKWDELPKAYKAVLENAAQTANTDMQAKYDARNPGALKRLVTNGAQLRPFSQEIMEACYKSATDLYVETAAQNASFKKLYDSYAPFRNDEYLWFQVAEYSFDNFMIRQRAKG